MCLGCRIFKEEKVCVSELQKIFKINNNNSNKFFFSLKYHGTDLNQPARHSKPQIEC